MKFLRNKTYKDLKKKCTLRGIRKERYKLAYEDSLRNWGELFEASVEALEITREEMLLNIKYQMKPKGL